MGSDSIERPRQWASIESDPTEPGLTPVKRPTPSPNVPSPGTTRLGYEHNLGDKVAGDHCYAHGSKYLPWLGSDPIGLLNGV